MPTGVLGEGTDGLRTSANFVRSSVLPYLRVPPVGFRNAVRLWAGSGASLRPIATVHRHRAVGERIPGRSPVTVSVLGVKFQVRPGTNDLDLLVHHEPETLAWFRVHPGDVVVDVGAHIGRYTVLGARLGGDVVSIEPDPANFEMLAANVRLNRLSNVHLERVAVSDANGVRRFLPSTGSNRGTSALASTSGSCSLQEGVLVECRCLDDIVECHGLSRIDWLKIDIEGHEVEALRGASRCLSITRWLSLEVTAESEEACRSITDRAGFRIEAEERGDPASNLLMRRA